jgi:hypothetical protein
MDLSLWTSLDVQLAGFSRAKIELSHVKTQPPGRPAFMVDRLTLLIPNGSQQIRITISVSSNSNNSDGDSKQEAFSSAKTPVDAHPMIIEGDIASGLIRKLSGDAITILRVVRLPALKRLSPY